MTRDEHLLTIAGEECNEIAQRIAKALRFGMHQVQEDADDKPEENPDKLSNRMRIRQEYIDFCAVIDMIDPNLRLHTPDDLIPKQLKVERYLLRSDRCGTLSDGQLAQLRAAHTAAGDRRDWMECDRLEEEIEKLGGRT